MKTSDRPRQVLNYGTSRAGADPDELAPLTPGMCAIRGLLLLIAAIVVAAIVLAMNAIRIWGIG